MFVLSLHLPLFDTWLAKYDIDKVLQQEEFK